jgi:hypothetical protein
MNKTILRTFGALILAGATAMAGSAAHATPVSYDWSATVNSGGKPAFGLAVGDNITGTLTFDTTGATLDYGSNYQDTGYQYYRSMANLITTVNLGSFHGAIPLYIMVENNMDMWLGDGVAFRSDATPFGPFALQLADTSDKALTSLALPTAIDFSAFSSNTVSSYSMGFFNATLTQFAPAGAANSAVPEPATTALFALALAGLAAARRRRRVR